MVRVDPSFEVISQVVYKCRNWVPTEEWLRRKKKAELYAKDRENLGKIQRGFERCKGYHNYPWYLPCMVAMTTSEIYNILCARYELLDKAMVFLDDEQSALQNQEEKELVRYIVERLVNEKLLVLKQGM